MKAKKRTSQFAVAIALEAGGEDRTECISKTVVALREAVRLLDRDLYVVSPGKSGYTGRHPLRDVNGNTIGHIDIESEW